MAINYQLFEHLLSIQKEGVLLEYDRETGTIKKTAGKLSDFHREVIQANREGLIWALSGGWQVDTLREDWIIITRTEGPVAVCAWRIGSGDDPAEWKQSYLPTAGGLTLFEERADGNAWRTRQVCEPTKDQFTTEQQGDFLLTFDSNGFLLDKHLCRSAAPAGPRAVPPMDLSLPVAAPAGSQGHLFEVA